MVRDKIPVWFDTKPRSGRHRHCPAIPRNLPLNIKRLLQELVTEAVVSGIEFQPGLAWEQPTG